MNASPAMVDFSRHAGAPIVMRFGAFGDMIMLLPMLRFLHRHTGHPVDLISSGGWNHAVTGSQPAVAGLQLLTSRKAPYWSNRSQRELVRWLRQQRGRPVFICETDEKSRWLVQRAGIPAGDRFWAGDDPFRPGEHWICRWLRIAHSAYGQPFAATDVTGLLRQGWLALDAAARADCEAWLQQRGWAGRRLVLVQAGSKRTTRRGRVDRDSNVKFWPHENWIQVGQAVLDADPDAQLLFCGSPPESDYAQELAQGVGNPRAAAVADDLPIPRLLALQERAAGMLSVDTGPAHAAAAMNCPLVVLFGEMDPAMWRPWAVDAPVEVVRAEPAVEVRSIPPARVLEAWARIAARSQVAESASS